MGSADFLLNLILFRTHGVWSAMAYHLLSHLGVKRKPTRTGNGEGGCLPRGSAGGTDRRGGVGRCALGCSGTLSGTTAREMARASLAAFVEDEDVRDEGVEEKEEDKEAFGVEEGAGPTGDGEESPTIHAET